MLCSLFATWCVNFFLLEVKKTSTGRFGGCSYIYVDGFCNSGSINPDFVFTPCYPVQPIISFTNFTVF